MLTVMQMQQLGLASDGYKAEWRVSDPSELQIACPEHPFAASTVLRSWQTFRPAECHDRVRRLRGKATHVRVVHGTDPQAAPAQAATMRLRSHPQALTPASIVDAVLAFHPH